MEKITKIENVNVNDSKLTWQDFSKKISFILNIKFLIYSIIYILDTNVARKSFLISIVLMALNQFCGCFAMLNYTASIFKESGSNLSPNMSAIVIGVIQLVGAYCSTFLVEKAGRKVCCCFY